MTLATVVTAFLAVLLNFGLFLLFYLKLKQSLVRFSRDMFEAQDENTPSQFAQVVTSVSTIQAQHISSSLKSVFMGVQSVDNRNERALEADAMADQNPTMAAIMESFPAVAKRVRKNPSLAGLAFEVLGRMSSRGTPGNNSAPGVKFNL
jgi:hypothetical protein